MGQTFTDDCFASGHVGQTDLQNIETNLQTLKSTFSGTGAPTNQVPGQLWFDTDNYVMKYREAGDASWYGVMHGDTSQKIWVYRNAAMNGWAIDSGVTDVVLALKGGTGLYNTTGATTAGESWANLKAHTHTGPSHSHAHGSHVHQVYNENGATDQIYNSSGVATNLTTATGLAEFDLAIATAYAGAADSVHKNTPDHYTSAALTVAGTTGSEGTGNTGAQSTADVRPTAAIGTLQYLDI